MRKFSPDNFTFEDFGNIVKNVLEQFSEVEDFNCYVEDSIPWIFIEGKKVIRPKLALALMKSLQSQIVDEVLFNSLSGNELKIVVNGKFHFEPKQLIDFQEDYANDFGCSIEEMKLEYEIK